MKTLRLVLAFVLLVLSQFAVAQVTTAQIREQIANGECETAQALYNVYKAMNGANKVLEREISECSCGVLLPIKVDGEYGYIDEKGKQIISPKFDRADRFKDGLALVRVSNKYGFIDKTGQYVISPQIDDLHDDFEFVEELCVAKVNGKWGYYNKAGRCVIKPQFENAWNFSEGLASVRLNGKWGAINTTGRFIIPCKYDYLGAFCEGLAVAFLNDKCGFVDKTDTMAIDFEYDDAYAFSEGLACVKVGDNWGYINKTGRMVIPAKFGYAHSFLNGIAVAGVVVERLELYGRVLLNVKRGLINKSGSYILYPNYSEIYRGTGDVFTVCLDGKWGIVDKDGRIVVRPQYDNAGFFSEGLVAVKVGDHRDGLWGYVNEKGSMVIPPQFNGFTAGTFQDGIAEIYTDDKKGFIDKTGKIICLY